MRTRTLNGWLADFQPGVYPYKHRCRYIQPAGGCEYFTSEEAAKRACLEDYQARQQEGKS